MKIGQIVLVNTDLNLLSSKCMLYSEELYMCPLCYFSNKCFINCKNRNKQIEYRTIVYKFKIRHYNEIKYYYYNQKSFQKLFVKNLTEEYCARKIQTAWRSYKTRQVLKEFLPADCARIIMQKLRLIRDDRDAVWIGGYEMPALF